ncbi:MAG: PAS domain S-box protein [Candidatus Thorarchaeota archaeon]|nr:MAG: PAS domain S-box protein [Candidatus Thorarchaeota archaeon]
MPKRRNSSEEPVVAKGANEDILIFRALVDAMNEGFGVVDRDSCFTYVNRHFHEMLGYTQSEMVGRALTDFVDAGNRETLLENVRMRTTGGSSQYELEWLTKDGRNIPTIVSGAPLFDEEDKHIGSYAVITDISRIREAEDERRKSEEKYRLLAENSLQGLTIIQGDKYVYVNPAFGRMVGYSPIEILEMPGRVAWNIIHEEDQSYLLELADRRRRGEEIEMPYRYRLVHSNGDVKYVEAFSSRVEYEGRDALQVLIIDITERHLAETELRESEERLRRLIDTSPDAITVSDIEGNFTMASLRTAAIHGYDSPEEMLGMSAFELFHEDEQEKAAENLRLVLSDGSVRNVETILKRKDGTSFPAELSVSLVSDAEGAPAALIGVTHDITERKRREIQLIESQAMLKLVMNTIPSYVFWKNTESEYIGCNQNFAIVSGVGTPDKIVGKTDYDLLWSKEEAARFQQDDREILKSDIPVYRRVEKQIQADGIYRWIEISKVPLHDAEGASIGILGTYEDITERVKAEESIRKSEERYRMLAERSLQGITIITDDGFVYVNKAYADIVGRGVEELMKMTLEKVESLYHPVDLEELKRIRGTRRPDTSRPPRHEYRLLRPDGSVRWVEAFSSGIDYEGGIAMQTVALDITERRKAEKEVQTAKDRALLYLDLMCHDLRNQMQVILNSATLLRSATDDTVRNNFLEVIRRSVQRASRLIGEVQETEQLLTVPLVEKRLDTALRSCTQAIEGRSDTEFESLIGVDDARVMADEFLELLLSNILINAVEHNKDAEIKKVWVTLESAADHYVVSIADNGPGLSRTRKEELFDMARRFGGVGLHQASQIAEKYGGRIEVEDRVDGKPIEGAKFKVWIPRAIPSSPE